jgi:hypothetical protein
LPKSSGEGMGCKVKKLLREMNVLYRLIPKNIQQNVVFTGVLAEMVFSEKGKGTNP